MFIIIKKMNKNIEAWLWVILSISVVVFGSIWLLGIEDVIWIFGSILFSSMIMWGIVLCINAIGKNKENRVKIKITHKAVKRIILLFFWNIYWPLFKFFKKPEKDTKNNYFEEFEDLFWACFIIVGAIVFAVILDGV